MTRPAPSINPGPAIAAELLEAARRQDDTLRQLLARDSEYTEAFKVLGGKLRLYYREESSGASRALEREILHAVERIAERAARILGDAAELAAPATRRSVA